VCTLLSSRVGSVVETENYQLTKGQTFQHYEIIEQIGVGGMGELDLAQYTKLDRKVAIKVMSQSTSQKAKEASVDASKLLKRLAPQVRLELTTLRLTVGFRQ